MENQAPEQQSPDDVRKSGYLRKQKSMHRRYFVLRAASERGPARLEYYESEKKFRAKAPVPKRSVSLETCFNINKRADAKNKYMIVLYTRAESFAVAAESESDQGEWFQAMLDLQCKSKAPGDSGSGGDYGVPSPGPAFKEVWQVKVWPKGLGQAKNLVGVYRLCLTEKTVSFVKLNSDAAAVVLQLMNVRRCGHSENFFFVEVGRSAMTGPGEFWMQVDDSVVAQNMHETLLEAMKALSEEFRQRSKSQSAAASGGGGGTASNPISVPSRRHHPNPPPSQVGFTRRPRTEPPGPAGGGGGANASPTARHGFIRLRTASDGGGKAEEGALALGPGSSPNGSCSGTPILRSKSARSATPSKNPAGLMRSISTPTPSAGPSLSSSTGHGSEFGLAVGAGGVQAAGFARAPNSASVSGSPSDYGSSDEYGSSPGEHAELAGGSVGSLGDEASNYILMGQRGAPWGQGRRVLRRSSSRESETERRALSKRASLPPMALERGGSRRGAASEAEADEDYAMMSRSASRESFSSRRDSASGGAGGSGYLDVAGEQKEKEDARGGVGVDNGYMSMLPGVTAASPASLSSSLSAAASDPDSKPADDYMAMTPSGSVSPPQRIRPPLAGSDGYMVMSPHSSCSPDGRGGMGGAWMGGGSADSRPGSDYMNMSPISTPPPAQEHQQQPPPKMVYSYYSLPRSYKHTPAAKSEEDAGRGRKPCAGRGGGCPGPQEHGAAGGPPATARHLSLSSSSYSSSSASSESLGEPEDRGGSQPGTRSKEGALQQRRASGGQKQGLQHRGRPVSLFVDVSKASTLPRVRESPCSVEPRSPGEYVSIEFRAERVGGGRLGVGPPLPCGAPRGSQRPISCLAGFQATPQSPATAPPAASEYVNMELGPSPSPSPSPVSLTPHGFLPYPTPPAPPVVAPKVMDECRPPAPEEDSEGGPSGPHRTPQTEGATGPEPPSAFTDYTEMFFGSSAPADTEPGSGTTARAPSPAIPEPAERSLGLGLDFSLPKVGSNPDQGAKVIRADPQGRRRHCSETFLPPPPPPSSSSSSSSSSSLFHEHAHPATRRFGLEAALRGAEGPAQCSVVSIATPPGGSQASSGEQGLNYIDLDLANKENSHPALDGSGSGQPLPPRLYSSGLSVAAGGAVGGGGGSSNGPANLNTYASIDFYRSEELRSHQGGGRDGTEC
ncbi:insulin receptor substrate 1-B-like [Paramormyrops kingsleyae]|uniref:Si:ch73-335l21.1 n=1 Tax=Paramormyrops kingsleyae TaxID=1676925 RepID=A0A3B3S0J6_9TELE|nr:insulin receptor substrate 1-B-like [Paramormyrops kingsleyae]